MRKSIAHLILALIATAACVVATAGQTQTTTQTSAQAVVLTASAQAAWGRVRQAATPQQQALEVRAFLAALATANGRPIMPTLDVRDLASGRAVSLDDPAVLQRPQAHEATVSVAGQFLVFRPLSRASLDPFFGR
jgi:hypothetical protein